MAGGAVPCHYLLISSFHYPVKGPVVRLKVRKAALATSKSNDI